MCSAGLPDEGRGLAFIELLAYPITGIGNGSRP